ncbi:MAG: carboxypeptidase-like regulatory domain-containing protein [Flavobacteriaceae bacterium]
MSTILTIPKPCSENWNKMTPTQKGAYCKNCQKEVIDFTKTPKIVLAKKLSKGSNLCGRFKSEQLNFPLPSISRSAFQRNVAALGFTSLLVITNPLAAQENVPIEGFQKEQHIIMGRITPESTYSQAITINGVVSDGELPIPGTNVSIKGTQIGTKTDFDGNFSISLSNTYRDSQVTLLISSLGFQPVEKKINLSTNFVTITCSELEEDILGELVIVRKQNIFRRFFNLFRRK